MQMPVNTIIIENRPYFIMILKYYRENKQEKILHKK